MPLSIKNNEDFIEDASSPIGILSDDGYRVLGVDNHDELSGLTDDDHTQYLLAAGTRNLTGDLLATTNVALNFRDTDTYVHSNASGALKVYANTVYLGKSGDTIVGANTTSNFKPYANGTVDLGTTSLRFGKGWFKDVCDFSVEGGRTMVSTANLGTPPTSAACNTEFGSPATLGTGWFTINDSGGSGTNVYIIVSTGSEWTYSTLTVL